MGPWSEVPDVFGEGKGSNIMNGEFEMPKCKHNMPTGSGWAGMSQMVTTCSFCEAEQMRERIAELEDTIRLGRATDLQHSSFGRDELANRVLADIAARRGEDWTGAEVSSEPASPAHPRSAPRE